MGVFSRFKDILNSNINTLLDKAEDPEKMIKMMLQEMEDTLIELKSSCAGKMAEEAKLRRGKAEADKMAQRWQKRAELAISRNLDDLAREALIEKRKVIAESEKLKNLLVGSQKNVESAKSDISKLESKLGEVRLKLKAVQEKSKILQEERRAANFYDRKKEEETFNRFSQMEEKIDRMASENELNNFKNSTETKFQNLEEQQEIEKEFEELKKNRSK